MAEQGNIYATKRELHAVKVKAENNTIQAVSNLMSINKISKYGTDIVNFPFVPVAISYVWKKANGSQLIDTIQFDTDALYKGKASLLIEVVEQLELEESDLKELTRPEASIITLLPGALRLPESAENTEWDTSGTIFQDWLYQELHIRENKEQ